MKINWFLILFIFAVFLIYSPDTVSAQKYFQQRVNYKIDVTLNDSLHELSAFEEIEYINNSPDTLKILYFHLWPNAYANNKTALAKQLFEIRGKQKLFNDPELRGSIDSLDFRIDGVRAGWHLSDGNIDICEIIPSKSILPHAAVTITTPFHVKIPKGVTSRLGHIGQSYQISQWYPKPAVYDRNGWHPMPYLDQGEFYSEFGSYDVSITLASNYIVGSTGILQDEEEREMLRKIAEDTSWIHTTYEKDNVPPSSGRQKTLRFKEDNIHDFAWFADKRFLVLKGSVTLPGSGKKVNTMALFTGEQSAVWKNSIFYINRAISFFSKAIGDYPYQTFTAVQSAITAGSGMEYPGITVIGNVKDDYSLDEVLTHEIAHSWFYAALGFNERRFPFMDEGITSAYETRYMNTYYPDKKLWELYFKNDKLARIFNFEKVPVARGNELEWLSQSRRNLEQPLNLPATEFNVVNYNVMIYNKAALVFNYLRAYVGDSLFDTTMKQFYLENKFIHPGPDDLRRSFESGTGKDLSWFFEDLLGTNKRLDYKLSKLNDNQLLVKNKGELKSPFVIAEMKLDSIISQKWYDGFSGNKWITVQRDNLSALKLDPEHVMPELFRLNNHIRSERFPRTEAPLQTRFYFAVENYDKSTIMYFPAINWTNENGFMAGVAFHNGILIPKRFEYLFVPFYSFKNNFAGYGKVSYNIIPYDSSFRMITLNAEGTRFGAPGEQSYHHMKVGLELSLRGNESAYLRQKLFGYYTIASDLQKILDFQKASLLSYWHAAYFAEKKSLINPLNLLVNLEISNEFQKSTASLHYRISYYGVNRGLDFRLFAGKMIHNKSLNSFYALAPSGRSGRDDYLFQGTFPGRFAEFPTTFLSKQMNLNEGGLVSPVNKNIGYSDWLLSLSMTSHLPGKATSLPIKPFLNFLLDDHSSVKTGGSPFFYEAGFKAGAWNLFEIYLPFLVSDNISNTTGRLKDRIRFVFKLDAIFRTRKV